MASTIQLKENTKKALFIKKNKLERKLKRKMTYDELVLYLLSEQEQGAPKLSLEELIGSISKDELDVCKELRKE